jgi:O-antigen/teichoic acid export membrane protein
MRWLRRIGGSFALSLFDQAILSGSAFVLTLVLAHVLDVRSFGSFSIAWSLSILIEVVLLRGLFDDGLPAAAHRIPRGQWRQLRLGLYLSSLAAAGLLGGLTVAGGLALADAGETHGALAVATGLAIPANRLQNVFRRICYLDGKLRRVVASSLIYLLALAASVAAMIMLGQASPAAGMACVAISASLAGAVAFAYPAELLRPEPRLLRWLLARLFRGGRWFVATSLTYWIGNAGLIPLCGLLIGLEASATLRILLLLFAPLGQFCAAIVSVRIPEIARELRAGKWAAVASAARSNALLFGAIAVVYGLAMALFGERFVSLALGGRAYAIGPSSLALMAVAMGWDAIWLGLSLPLVATGRPQKFIASRIAGLVVLCCALPFAGYAFGLDGVISSMAMASFASVVVVVLTNFKHGGRE